MAFKDLKVNDVQRLEEGQKRLEGDVSELKRDVSKLQIGQNRVEKQIHLNNAAINKFAGEQVRIRGIVTELEKATV